MEITIAELQKLGESEDHIEFKEAKHNYTFAGGKHVDLKDRRRCVLGCIVALANEKGGRLVLGMVDHMPHAVVGSDFSAKICEGLTIEDLDKEAIAEMKTQYARKQENPLFQNYPDEQVLSDLDLLKDGKLNYAALILLGKSEAIRKYLPQNNIVVEFRMYHSMIQYTARKEFQLLLFIAIDKVWDYINQPASNPLLHYNDGPYIFDIPSFNKEAVREWIKCSTTASWRERLCRTIREQTHIR